MTERISLVEAYDNRDVIAQLVRLRDNVDELLNILKDIDPNGDLTNVVTKTGDQTIDGVKTFIGQIVADCDIIQNGAAYETHAEQVYSVNDLIVTRDGQITGLAPGDMSGFHVKKYNGVDDSRLGVDSTGTMRVGDVGLEQPLMTRDEAANLTGGDVLLWDSVGQKAIGQAKDTVPTQSSSALVTSDGIFTALSDKAVVKAGNKFIQSGLAANTGGSVTFPTPFTSNNPIVMVAVRTGSVDTNLWVTKVKTTSNTGFTFEARYSADGSSWPLENNVVIMWLAIGD